MTRIEQLPLAFWLAVNVICWPPIVLVVWAALTLPDPYPYPF